MKKIKILISGTIITFIIVCVTMVVANINKNKIQIAEKEDSQSQTKIEEKVNKKIYGTFKTEASWVKDRTEIYNVIGMASNYSIVKAKVISKGETQFLQPNAPTPYTSIEIDIKEV